jgi:predicted ABC-type ATPase
VKRRAAAQRMRMFAGPNGSGKTTVQREISRQFSSHFLGVLVNPDDLEASIGGSGRLDLGEFGVRTNQLEVRDFFAHSSFLKQHQLADAATFLRCDGNSIDFAGMKMNSYYASVLADFLRRKLLAASTSFAFETVMSEPGKVALLKEAQELGFRTYLYYLATEDPEINAWRVEMRVAEGGHSVPREKIISRYYRSLGLVRAAISPYGPSVLLRH